MFSLAVALASLVLVVAALLAIPVSLVVDIERTARLRSRLRVHWLFGLVDVELGRRQPSRASPTRPSTKAGQPPPAVSRATRPGRGRGPAIALALVRTEGLAGRIQRLFRARVVRGPDTGQADLAAERGGRLSLLAADAESDPCSLGSSTMKRLRAGQPIVVDDLRLIPVESTQLYADQTSGRFTAVAAKEPVALVVCVAGRVWALDLEGRETSLSALLRDVEGLQHIVP